MKLVTSQLLHHHQHHQQHPHPYHHGGRGVIEFSKDESESDNAALSDQNCDYILPITQIVAEHQKKQVKFCFPIYFLVKKMYCIKLLYKYKSTDEYF